MSHVRIVINDTLEFDGEPHEWQTKPPDLFRDMIKPNTKPAPWMIAIATTMNDALMRDEPVDIIVTHRSNRWQMNVETK